MGVLVQWLWVTTHYQEVVGSNPGAFYRWTFFALICCKNYIVCLKRPKRNEKEAGVGPFKKRLHLMQASSQRQGLPTPRRQPCTRTRRTATGSPTPTFPRSSGTRDATTSPTSSSTTTQLKGQTYADLRIVSIPNQPLVLRPIQTRRSVLRNLQ